MQIVESDIFQMKINNPKKDDQGRDCFPQNLAEKETNKAMKIDSGKLRVEFRILNQVIARFSSTICDKLGFDKRRKAIFPTGSYNLQQSGSKNRCTGT